MLFIFDKYCAILVILTKFSDLTQNRKILRPMDFE